jgi:hypothetical protein
MARFGRRRNGGGGREGSMCGPRTAMTSGLRMPNPEAQEVVPARWFNIAGQVTVAWASDMRLSF